MYNSLVYMQVFLLLGQDIRNIYLQTPGYELACSKHYKYIVG